MNSEVKKVYDYASKLKYVERTGWQGWVSDGAIGGTEGQSKTLEAIRIKLENMPGYSIEYRAHVAGYGWQKWKKDGEVAGTKGQTRAIEAIEIRVIKTEDAVQEPEVIYQAHVEKIGWQEETAEGFLAGTEGQSKRVEALKIYLQDAPAGAKIEYRTHVGGIGWQGWVSDGALTGTEGQSKRIEAIQIKLVGLDDYTIEYQVHIQDKGWSAWYIDAEVAGTVGQSKRIEAIRMRIVPKYKREYRGIDISEHQGVIDFDKLMTTGKVDFIIIRAGYGRNSYQKDLYFERNYAEAKKRNIPVGAYLYSYATDGVDGAIQEAYNMLGFLEGKTFELPVFYDIEDPTQETTLSKQTKTEMCLAFGRVMQGAGYKAGIYSSKDWLINEIDLNQIPEDFSIWVASWGKNDGNVPGEEYQFPGYHDIWQFTSTGHLDGIDGEVDMNICYRRYF